MRLPLTLLSQILALLMIPVMLISIWLHIQVLDNHRYTASMRALGGDASFQAAFGDQISRLLNHEITKLSDSEYAVLAEQYVSDAGGIEAIQAVIQDAVASLIQSPYFVEYWVQLNQTTHQQLVDFARGESSVLVSNDRRGISLDLAMIASWVDPLVDGAASEALALATSDGVVQVPIAESRSFPPAEWVSRNSLAVAIGSIAIFVVLQTLAIVFATNRKQSAFFAVIGTAIVSGATVLTAKTLVSDHLASIRDAGGRALAREYVNAVMSDLVILAVAVALGSLLVGVVLAALPYVRRSPSAEQVSPIMPRA